jgi:hypothetical protein
VSAQSAAADGLLEAAEEDLANSGAGTAAAVATIGVGRAVLALAEEVEALVELFRDRLRPDPQIGSLQDLLEAMSAGDPTCVCGHKEGLHNRAGDHCWGNHPEACGCPGFEATP